jgi:hypothetical protein
MRRTLVSSEQGLEGKLFVEFIALIYLSYVKKRMQEAGLFKDYTLQSALDKLDVIECFEHPGQRLLVGEILEKRRKIHEAMDVQPPASLCVGGNQGFNGLAMLLKFSFEGRPLVMSALAIAAGVLILIGR